MKYMNGREAVDGDFVVGQDIHGNAVAGRITNLSDRGDSSSGSVLVPTLQGLETRYVALNECVHAEDAMLGVTA